MASSLQDVELGHSGDVTVDTRRRRSTKTVDDMTFLQAWYYYFDLENGARQLWPVVTVLLPITWIVVFAVTAQHYGLRPFKEAFSSNDRRAMESLQYPGDVRDDHKYWQLYTYAFIHASVPHLVANVCSFLFFSYYIETKYRWYRVFVIWSICSLSSGLFYCMALKADDDSGNLVGASGGVYGVMGAFISESVLNRETVRWKKVKICVTIVLLASHVYEYVEDVGGYGVYAHLGGLVCGLGPVMLYLPNYKVEDYEWILMLFAGAIFVVIFIALPIYVLA